MSDMKNIKCNYATKMIKQKNGVATISSGERFIVNTINAFGGDFDNIADLKSLIDNKYGDKHHHPLTGPVKISGAEPGDVLKISIHKINIKNMAQGLSRSAGISPITSTLFADRSPIKGCYDQEKNDIYYLNDLRFEYRPMIGIIGVAFEEEVRTGHAYKTGGNLDLPSVSEESVVYMPVNVKEADLYFGDAHGTQGYGELGGIALEASADIEVSVEILKPFKPLNYSFIVGNEPLSEQCSLSVIGISEEKAEIKDAIQKSYQNSIDLIQRMLPSLNKSNIGNIITLIGNNVLGQAFSNTAETTSAVIFKEKDFKKLLKNETFSLTEHLEKSLFTPEYFKNKKVITIGSVKGKLINVVNEFLTEIKAPIIENTKQLFHVRELDNCVLHISLMRWADLNKYSNRFDLIIYGSDQWLENGHKSMISLKYFKQGDCRLSLLVPDKLKNKPLEYFTEKRVATGFPFLAKTFLNTEEKNIVEISGSSEIMTNLGWADSVFDIVESGQSAKIHGLAEYKKIINFGAVMATNHISYIQFFENAGLIKANHNKITVAFEGIDGSRKSTLSKYLTSIGINDLPTSLICPYSGYVGSEANAFLKQEDIVNWATVIGKNHWNTADYTNQVYDRSILTCLTELIHSGMSAAEIKNVISTWGKLPDLIVFCHVSIEHLKLVYEQRHEKDDYDNISSVLKYMPLYENAAKFAEEILNIQVFRIKTDENDIEGNIELIKKAIKEIN